MTVFYRHARQIDFGLFSGGCYGGAAALRDSSPGRTLLLETGNPNYPMSLDPGRDANRKSNNVNLDLRE
jgi:hypothetical protein